MIFRRRNPRMRAGKAARGRNVFSSNHCRIRGREHPKDRRHTAWGFFNSWDPLGRLAAASAFSFFFLHFPIATSRAVRRGQKCVCLGADWPYRRSALLGGGDNKSQATRTSINIYFESTHVRTHTKPYLSWKRQQEEWGKRQCKSATLTPQWVCAV